MKNLIGVLAVCGLAVGLGCGGTEVGDPDCSSNGICEERCAETTVMTADPDCEECPDGDASCLGDDDTTPDCDENGDCNAECAVGDDPDCETADDDTGPECTEDGTCNHDCVDEEDPDCPVADDDDDPLEPYRWIEGVWFCQEGSVTTVGNNYTVEVVEMVEAMGVKVDGFTCTDTYVTMSEDGYFFLTGTFDDGNGVCRDGVFDQTAGSLSFEMQYLDQPPIDYLYIKQ